jgi:hypothetical protein
VGIHTSDSEGMVNSVDLPVRLTPSDCRVIPHARRICALGEQERGVVVNQLQEMTDETRWEVDEREFVLESFGASSAMTAS